MTPLLTTAAVILGIIAALLIALLIRFYQKCTIAMCTSKKRLDGKVAIVTGGTAGIGFEIAREFARRGATVVIACPFEQEGSSAQKTILEEVPNANVVFKLLDLGSLKSVREFAEYILKTQGRLDLLMLNAGVGVPRDFKTEDGMDFIMQVNYYGHFLLTILILPLLKKSGTRSDPSRIVTTSSMLHYIGTTDVESMNRGNYCTLSVYSNSKFCSVLFARELSKRLKGAHVVANSFDPGTVGTGIYKSTGKCLGAILTRTIYFFNKTPWHGAQTALHVALDAAAGAASGQYFKNCAVRRAKRAAYRDQPAGALWGESVKLVKLTDKELEESFGEITH